MNASSVQRVLFVYWRGGAIDSWHNLLSAGAMPRLSLIRDEGALVDLAPLSRSGSEFEPAAVATTIATGCLPDRHGVLTDREPRLDGLGLRDASRDIRAVPTVWEIAQREGRSAMSVGWPATHPARAGDGAVIATDALAQLNSMHPDYWPMPSDCILPVDWREDMRPLRVSPMSMTSKQIGAIMPSFAKLDQQRDDALHHLRMSLARVSTDHAIGTYMAEGDDWDLLCTHFCFVDDVARFRREFRSRSVGQDGTSPLDEMPDNALAFLDLTLGRYMKLVGRETTLIVAADSPGGASQPGFLGAIGPGIRPGTTVKHLHPVNIAPTILSLLGISRPATIDGRAHASLLQDVRIDEPLDSWRYDALAMRAETVDDLQSAQERDRIKAMAADLVARGYALPPNHAASELRECEQQRQTNHRRAAAARQRTFILDS